MGECHIAAALTFASALALGASEEREEIVSGHHTIGQLRGAQTVGEVGKLQGPARGHGDGVQHLLGAQSTGQGMREVDQVVFVPAVGYDAQLVSPRQDQIADEFSDIVPVGHKTSREGIQ